MLSTLIGSTVVDFPGWPRDKERFISHLLVLHAGVPLYRFGQTQNGINHKPPIIFHD